MPVNQKIQKKWTDGNIFIINDENDTSIKIIEKCLNSIIKKLENFYRINHPKIVIELFYSREEFNKKAGYKTPEWFIGFTVNNNICLLSPLVIEKVSLSHKKSEFLKILTHEICHIFNSEINKNILMWVDEGISLYLAGQKKKPGFEKKDLDFFLHNIFDKNIKINLFAEHNGYRISYWAVRTAVKILGKKKLLDLACIDRRKNYRQKIEEKLNMTAEKFLKKMPTLLKK